MDRSDHRDVHTKITYVYEYDGHVIEISRHHFRTAYAKNGNAHNPTEYYLWSCKVDTVLVTEGRPRRADAYEHGRARILNIHYRNNETNPSANRNVRPWRQVEAEMRENYRGRRMDVPGALGGVKVGSTRLAGYRNASS